jgi:hypothetical protein
MVLSMTVEKTAAASAMASSILRRREIPLSEPHRQCSSKSLDPVGRWSV